MAEGEGISMETRKMDKLNENIRVLQTVDRGRREDDHPGDGDLKEPCTEWMYRMPLLYAMSGRG